MSFTGITGEEAVLAVEREEIAEEGNGFIPGALRFY
jgi:hypothetical protein